jgi:serine/threonine protein phosphatase PrpC
LARSEGAVLSCPLALVDPAVHNRAACRQPEEKAIVIRAETLCSDGINVDIAVLSEAGGRAVNEDACGYCTAGTLCCCVLSDGAGGHGCGEVAAQVVVRTVLQKFRDAPGGSPETVAMLLDAANEAVLAEQRQVAEQSDMRATAAILIIDVAEAKAIWGHVGDSRIYVFRHGTLSSQTRDHSVVQAMVDAGFLAAESVRTSPKRSVLTAAVGDAGGCEGDIPAAPLDLAAEEVFLICSDGFWEYVDERVLEAELGRAVGPEPWLGALEADLLRNARANHDNYSAIAVWLSSQEAILF